MAEFKIITDGRSINTQIFVDDEQIGLIQDINFSASVQDLRPNIFITFAYIENVTEKYIELLSEFDFVHIRVMK